MLARDGTPDDLREALRDGLPEDGGAGALHMAASWRRADVVKVLLDAGVRADARTHGDTALHGVVRQIGERVTEEERAVVALLMSRGTDVNARNAQGETALWVAAWEANPAAVTLLLSLGARADIADARGRTPLAAATDGSFAEVCSYTDATPPGAERIAEVVTALRGISGS